MDVVNVVYLLNQKIISKYNYTSNCDFNESEEILSDQLLLVIENLVGNLNIICEDEFNELFIDENLPTEDANYSDEESEEDRNN